MQTRVRRRKEHFDCFHTQFHHIPFIPKGSGAAEWQLDNDSGELVIAGASLDHYNDNRRLAMRGALTEKQGLGAVKRQWNASARLEHRLGGGWPGGTRAAMVRRLGREQQQRRRQSRRTDGGTIQPSPVAKDLL
ncbi:hypothetical protein AAHA92_00384 [Salvia divinorum]|uniref:Uncharacterized protein n=1 Tax=Salvia divinorum TaxID=28513 RepID=A0ABD1ILW4_SALDI